MASIYIALPRERENFLYMGTMGTMGTIGTMGTMGTMVRKYPRHVESTQDTFCMGTMYRHIFEVFT